MEWKKSTMGNPQRYLIGTFFYAYIMMGVFYSLIGSSLPMIQEEYHLDYQISGMMMTVLSTGYLAAGASVSTISRFFGAKRTYLVLSSLLMVGLLLLISTDKPPLLFLSMALTGVSRGCIDTFGNQKVSEHGNAVTLNLLQACYSVGTCIAPVVAIACRASWKTAFLIIIGMGVGNALLSSRLTMRSKAEDTTGKKILDLGFFREKLFWLCVMMLLTYLAVEDSFIGWMVTYLVDAKGMLNQSAQILAAALWMSILFGRLLSAWLAKQCPAHFLLLGMAIGFFVFFALLIVSRHWLLITIGVVGLGLFMAGIYGTTLANSGDLMERYPMCTGMFIAIPGIGAAIIPGAIGIAANRVGMQGGMCILLVVIALLGVTSVCNVVYQNNKVPQGYSR